VAERDEAEALRRRRRASRRQKMRSVLGHGKRKETKMAAMGRSMILRPAHDRREWRVWEIVDLGGLGSCEVERFIILRR
jgi:hypothetical protein